MNLRLGKLAPRHDPRTLKLETYASKLAPAPATCDLTSKLSHLGMMKNDTLGDCTCAAVGHTIQLWTAEIGKQVILSDQVIEQLYERFGYRPGDPSTDNGAVEIDVLNSWRNNPVSGHKLTAYASVAVHKPQQIKDAVYYFGAAYIGFNVPAYLMPDNGDVPQVWDVEPTKDGSLIGGHAVILVSYNEVGLKVISWGHLYTMTWAFLGKYVDEAYALFGPDWVCTASGKCPTGFNLAALQQDLQEIAGA